MAYHDHAHNCGGTDCPCVTFTISGRPCRHLNGWYETVQFLWFRRRYFICTDCERMILTDRESDGNGR